MMILTKLIGVLIMMKGREVTNQSFSILITAVDSTNSNGCSVMLTK